MNTKELLFLGVRHAVPIVFGYIPVGIAYAVYAQQTGFSAFETILLSITGYSGSGQFLTVSMTSQNAGLLAIGIGIFLLNFRYFIMSTCVFNRFKRLNTFKKIFMSHLVTDETIAIFTTAEERLVSEAYFIGLFVTSYLSWILGAVLGILANSFLPESLTLAMGIALYALFIAIIMPGCKRDIKIFILVLCTAVMNCILSNFLDMSWSIVISSLVCAFIGAFFIKKNSENKRKGELTDE